MEKLGLNRDCPNTKLVGFLDIKAILNILYHFNMVFTADYI